MNRETFIETLKLKLSFLSLQEKKEVILYYQEMIEENIEDGLTEEEAIQKIGTLQSIVKKIKDEQEEKIPSNKMSGERTFLLILLSPFIFTLMLIWICLLIMMYSLVFCVYIFGFSFLVIAIAYCIDFFFSLFLGNYLFSLLEIGLGILSVGLAMLLLMSSTPFFKKMNIFSKESFSKINKWIRGF